MAKIDKAVLKSLYKEYNALYFNNLLPTPRFSVFKGRKSVGLMISNFKSPRQSCLQIARNIYWTEDTLKSVIVHEMIHFKLGIENGNSEPKHGKRFRAEADRLNSQFGLNITKDYPTLNFTDFEIPTSLWGRFMFWLMG